MWSNFDENWGRFVLKSVQSEIREKILQDHKSQSSLAVAGSSAW